MGKIGYHIHLGGLGQQKEESQQNAKKADAPFHLLVTSPDNGIHTEEEIAVLDSWAKALSPAQIIWRSYSSLEGDWSMFPSNTEIVKHWLSEDRPQYIRDDPANEPALSGNDPDVNSHYVKSRADLLRKAAAVGIKVAVGAFKVGTPDADLIADGSYDDLIRAVIEGEHYFSVHEFCPGIPGAGDIFDYSELLEPDSVSKVMKANPWPTEASYRHLRHSDNFVLRARELGLADPQIIVTESFLDFIPDAHEVIEELQDKYGIPAYDKDLRGVLAWRMYYADTFPLKRFSDVLTQLCKYLDDNVYYPDYIRGVCLYSLNWDLDNPQAHNFLDPFLDDFRRNGLPNLSEAYSILTPPPSPPPSAADTISTRSPEFWAKIKELTVNKEHQEEMEDPLSLDISENSSIDEAQEDITEDSTADGIPEVLEQIPSSVLSESSDESNPAIRASSTVEIPAVTLSSLGGSRWQKGIFRSEGVRVRVAPFTDAEPIGLLSGEKRGEQHIGEIQSDGYTWRWIRFTDQDNVVEGYAASAFYDFKVR